MGGLLVFMDELITYEKQIASFDVNQIMLSIWERKDVQDLIIKLNTQGHPGSQLYELGQDALGEELGQYTNFTIEQKVLGDGDSRIDHITLKDTGGFYRSFRVFPFIKGFVLLANPITDDGTNLELRFGKNITGLSEESINILLEFIEPIFTELATPILS